MEVAQNAKCAILTAIHFHLHPMASSDHQSEAYFYKLLLGKKAVRNQLSDIAEALLYAEDDEDEADTGSAHVQAEDVAHSQRLLAIGEDDKTVLLKFVFGSDVRDGAQLGMAIERSIQEAAQASDRQMSGMVFEYLFQYVAKNIDIADEDFVRFIQSNAKEEIENSAANACVSYLMVVEDKIREQLAERRSFLEEITKSPDFMDDTERESLIASLAASHKALLDGIAEDENVS